MCSWVMVRGCMQIVRLVPNVTACTTSRMLFITCAAPCMPLGDDKGNHSAAGFHLRLRECVLRVACQSGIVDMLHFGMPAQELRHFLSVGTVALHAHGQGFQVLQHQPGFEGLQDCADELGCVPADIFYQRLRSNDGAAQDGGVASQELGQESKMISAPISIGFCKAAVAVVLSTSKGTPCACATSATAATSVTSSTGLLGVSTQTSFVRLIDRLIPGIRVR